MYPLNNNCNVCNLRMSYTTIYESGGFVTEELASISDSDGPGMRQFRERSVGACVYFGVG